MKRFKTGFCLATALLLLAAGPLSAQMQVRVEPVRLAPIVDRLPLSGSVISPRHADVAPQESGLVRRMAVDVGDVVAEGDVLLELDDELLRLELHRLQAALEEARLLSEDAKRLADEGRRLVGERNISRSEYESRLASEAVAEQRRQQLSAEVEMQQTRVRRATVRAPFAGVIGLKMTEEGQWLAAGSPAFNLAQLDPLRVQARIPERFYGEVRPGTLVNMTFDAVPGETVQAAVDSVVAVSDLETRSFTARADIPNTKGRLAPGMSARLEFEVGAESSAPVLQVPADALVRSYDGSIVVWVVRDGLALPLAVTAGRRSGRHVEVNATGAGEGLRADDVVVTLGNESLREGQAVTAVRG
jgi:RND family efflux transporter MFP subunit